MINGINEMTRQDAWRLIKKNDTRYGVLLIELMGYYHKNNLQEVTDEEFINWVKMKGLK